MQVFSCPILHRLVLRYCKTAPNRSCTQPVLGLVNVWAIAKQVLTVPGWCIYTFLDYPKTKQFICHDITLGFNLSRLKPRHFRTCTSTQVKRWWLFAYTRGNCKEMEWLADDSLYHLSPERNDYKPYT